MSSQTERKDLFQYAVLHRDPKTGATTEVVKPTTLLAKTAEVAKQKAVRAVDDEWEDKLDELEVLVRQF